MNERARELHLRAVELSASRHYSPLASLHPYIAATATSLHIIQSASVMVLRMLWWHYCSVFTSTNNPNFLLIRDVLYISITVRYIYIYQNNIRSALPTSVVFVEFTLNLYTIINRSNYSVDRTVSYLQIFSTGAFNAGVYMVFNKNRFKKKIPT